MQHSPDGFQAHSREFSHFNHLPYSLECPLATIRSSSRRRPFGFWMQQRRSTWSTAEFHFVSPVISKSLWNSASEYAHTLIQMNPTCMESPFFLSGSQSFSLKPEKSFRNINVEWRDRFPSERSPRTPAADRKSTARNREFGTSRATNSTLLQG